MVPTLYMVVFTVRSGQTPGRRWLGQKVTRPNGQLLSYRAALLREIASLVNGLIFWFQGLYLIGMMKRLHLPSLGLEKALELSAELPRSGLDTLADAVYWFVWTSLVCTFLNEKKRSLEDFVAGAEVEVLKKELPFKSWEVERFDATENHFNESNWLILQSEFGTVIRVEIGALIDDVKDEFQWEFKS